MAPGTAELFIVVPFIMLEFVVLGTVAFFPGLALWLMSLVFGIWGGRGKWLGIFGFLLASFECLDRFEAFELRWAQVDALASPRLVAGIGMGLAEGLGPGPSLEILLAFPQRV